MNQIRGTMEITQTCIGFRPVDNRDRLRTTTTPTTTTTTTPMGTRFSNGDSSDANMLLPRLPLLAAPFTRISPRSPTQPPTPEPEPTTTTITAMKSSNNDRTQPCCEQLHELASPEAAAAAAPDPAEAEERERDRDPAEEQYLVAINASSSSYQQLCGSRYRLMNVQDKVWNISELNAIYYRRYQLRDCAMELFFSDNTSLMFQFFDANKRNQVFDAILSLHPPNLIESVAFFKQPSSKAMQSTNIHEMWCRREISNFEYLMKLNMFAGRTFNDLTQYPIMPWVLTDFESQTLDLKNKNIYRDLRKPMGALNEKRLEKFLIRYKSMMEDAEVEFANDANRSTDKHASASSNSIHTRPFLYGTHYSSMGTVLYYLLRMEPFTTYNLKFQDGRFDNANRLFHSIHDTFQGCLHNPSDVKELTPEFYYLSDFLMNKQNLDLGMKSAPASAAINVTVKQSSNNNNNGDGDGDDGEDDRKDVDEAKVRVNDVVLPPWANGSPETFIRMMNAALESDYVSLHLHHWIDLIFGCNQRGENAIHSYNVFHPYTYADHINIDLIEDPVKRRAILKMIDEFGQTPLQLFVKPHAQRMKASEMLSSIFQTKHVHCYGSYHVTENREIGISFISSMNKKLLIVGSDCCANAHKWSPSKFQIEKPSLLNSLSKKRFFSKLHIHSNNNNNRNNNNQKNRIGSNFSTAINNRNLCFAKTHDLQYVFGCGFVDCSFVVYDISASKNVQCITKHTDIVSCIAIADAQEINHNNTILVTGSYDSTVMAWRVHSRHSNNGNGNVVDPVPMHILTTAQCAPITCVDISFKSGIIVCCDKSGFIHVYNCNTGEHLNTLQPSIDKCIKENEKVIAHNNKRKLLSLLAQNKEHNNNNNNMDMEEEDMHMHAMNKVQKNANQNKNKTSNANECLSICRISSEYGQIIAYSAVTRDLFLYSSVGKLINYSNSRDDIYYDIVLNKTGTHMICGGKQHILRVKELPSFRTKKKWMDSKHIIRNIYVDKEENCMFVGCSSGNVLVYSFKEREIIEKRVIVLSKILYS